MQDISAIKNRIRSVEGTAKITKAMQMISTAKMNRALNNYNSNKMYNSTLKKAMLDIVRNVDEIESPYFTQAKGDKAAYLIVASDKGMAGGFNHGLFDAAEAHIKARNAVCIMSVGGKVREYLAARKRKPDVEFCNSASTVLQFSREIAYSILNLFSQGLFDEFYVAYNSFADGKVTPVIDKLLPIEDTAVDGEGENEESSSTYKAQILYDPSPEAVLTALVPQYLLGTIYGILTESTAAEHFSRMTAMSNATVSAEKILGELKTKYNRARQERITNEINEITAGRQNG